VDMYVGASFTSDDQELPLRKSIANVGCSPSERPNELTLPGDRAPAYAPNGPELLAASAPEMVVSPPAAAAIAASSRNGAARRALLAPDRRVCQNMHEKPLDSVVSPQSWWNERT